MGSARFARADGTAWCRLYAVVVLAGCAGLVWLPEDLAVLDPLYLGLLLSSGLVTLVAAVRSPADRLLRAGWGLLALGVLLYWAGDVLWVVYARQGRDPFPSPADVLFITGTLVMIGGAYLLARRVTGALDRWTQIDVALVAIAVGSVVWTQSVVPYVDGSDLLTAEGLVTGAYPVLDVLLTATIARMLVSSQRSTTAMRLLLSTLALLTVVDITYYRMELAGTYAEWGLLDGGFAIAVCGVGIASLHPTAFDRVERAGRDLGFGPSRLVMLVVAATTPLLLLGIVTALGLPGQGPVLALVGATSVGLLALRTWVLIGVSREVVELRHARQLSGMIRNANDALLVLDEDLVIAYASPSLGRRWDHDPEDLVGRPLEDLAGPGEVEPLRRWLPADEVDAGRDVHAALQSRWLDGRGRLRDVHITASRLDEEIAGGSLLLTARDITDRVALEDELRVRAERDALTGLSNRATFVLLLERSSLLGTASAVLFIDVDDFKDVNDVLGHDVGDELLRALGRRLASVVRPGDAVARLGGDEFAVLLTGVDDAVMVSAIADRVVAELGRPVEVAGRTVATSVSVGIATVQDAVDPVEVLRRADLAMYAAKRSGKASATVFDERLAEEAERDHELRSRLRSAVRDGEMWLAHQPIVELATGRVVGHEALLRWDLDGRAVGPDEFIPLAESSGEIVALGAWVLRRACAEAAGLLGVEPDGPVVSVNLSAVQLDEDIAGVVRAALSSSGLPPHRLQLELTESVMASEVTASAFLDLRRLGVRLAIDDFGTGWCSLAYLRRFPVGVVKVDRAFASDVVAQPGLLDGIATLIAATGAACLVEGIEEPEQHATVRDLGIAYAQGWLFGRPAPLADLVDAGVFAPDGSGDASVPPSEVAPRVG